MKSSPLRCSVVVSRLFIWIQSCAEQDCSCSTTRGHWVKLETSVKGTCTDSSQSDEVFSFLSVVFSFFTTVVSDFHCAVFTAPWRRWKRRLCPHDLFFFCRSIRDVCDGTMWTSRQRQLAANWRHVSLKNAAERSAPPVVVTPPLVQLGSVLFLMCPTFLAAALNESIY